MAWTGTVEIEPEPSGAGLALRGAGRWALGFDSRKKAEADGKLAAPGGRAVRVCAPSSSFPGYAAILCSPDHKLRRKHGGQRQMVHCKLEVIEFQRLEEHTMTRVGPVGWAERLLQQPSHSGKDAGSCALPPCPGCGRWGLLGAPAHTA